MATNKGKDILSSDLDIFGEDTGEEQTDVGGEYDIFGGAADSSESEAAEAGESPAEEATETPAEEAAEEGADKSGTSTDESKDKDKTEGEDETLDIDIEHLFDNIEAETKGNPELEQLIDSLRNEISTLTTDRNILQKENNTINEKLMSKVGDESNLGIYKGVISNLESNPKLMLLVKHLGNSSSDAIKGKLVHVVTDILYDLTGEDVSDLINKDQSSKILSATGKSSTASVGAPSKDKDEDVMDYDESISNLF